MLLRNNCSSLSLSLSVYGEIVVKQYEAVQTGLPLCVLGGLVAPATLSYKYVIHTLYYIIIKLFTGTN